MGISRGSPRFIETRNFKNFIKAKFIDDIKNTIWPSPNNEDNINIVWKEWKLKMLSILDKHAPSRTKRIRNKPSPWINSELKRELYAKDMLKKKFTKSNSPADWLQFKVKRNAVNQLVKKKIKKKMLL